MGEENIKLSTAQYGTKTDYATVRVPPEARMSTYSVTMIIIGLIIALSALYTGASFINGLTLSQMLGANMIGNVILCVYAGFMGVIGAREGMGVTMLSRHSFGRIGQGVISAIVALSLTGWYAWQCNFFGSTIHAMFPGAGFLTNPVVAGIWGGLMMMVTAYFGSKGLSFLSNFAAPLIFVVSIIGMGIATNSIGGWASLYELSQQASGDVSFTAAIVAVVGAFATGGIIQPDVTRFSKSAKSSLVAAIVGFIVVQFVVIAAGYIICLACATSDLPAALLMILGTWSLLILVFAQWTTNDNNLYSSSLAICSLLPKLNKKHVVLVVGVVAVALGASGLINNFVAFLNILGIAVPPVGGIIIADYFIVKKMKYQFGKGVRYGFVSIPAVISWVAACVVGFALNWGIGCINSMVVAFVLYLVLEACFKKNPDKKYIGGFCVEDENGNTTKCD